MALAPFACHPHASRGRRHAESPAVDRDDFQRDRDRIIHSSAFRRLVYKTQVFLNHEGDLFRTRLTHSLEVAQLGRGLARSLGLNEDLVEAIALAHDLGHTPFGHAGQDALAECMRGHGGFEHNLQSLRVVEVLEARYPGFDGLNLCFETREGILKHCSRRDAERLEAERPGDVGERFLTGRQPSLEAQLVDVVDAMAYNAHDIDDGVRSGLLALQDVAELPALARALAQAQESFERAEAQAPRAAPPATPRRLLYTALRRMLAAQVADLAQATAQRLAEHAPADADAVRALPRLVAHGAQVQSEQRALASRLFQALYRHPQVQRTSDIARGVVQRLFQHHVDHPQDLPPEYAARPDRHRAVADFVSGMTDRYARRSDQRLTGRDAFAAVEGPLAAGQA